jgi:glycosyltransferase involved in cell wall biosynthesis
MKVVHIIPGSGGTFYCQNCLRDKELIKNLRAMGNDVIMVPIYLPHNIDGTGIMGDTPVFYGAINVYLKEKMPFYRRAPLWIERLLDAESLLQMAAKKAGSTRATGLEEMTLSMLDGEHGRQSSELEHLITYLKEEIKPDIVHLSNALLLGLAKRLKNDLNASVVCSLQDENEWIDPMSQAYQKQTWDKMAERAVDVDAFVAASRYYADRSIQQLRLPPEKVHVVYGGIEPERYETATLDLDPPVIGYLCRMSEYFGLGIIADAFTILKQDDAFKNTKLHLMGGYTGDDKPFIKKVMRKLKSKKVSEDVILFEKFGIEDRIQFLKSLSVLSVPVPGGEAFGAYMIEALAAGVPIVQPNAGGYPEFVANTGGGVIYEPNDPEHLAETLAKVLSDRDKLKNLAQNGKEKVTSQYTMTSMASKIVDIYKEIM